ncbi:hypothetical protein SADUNF_Sadunf17G0071100 [Salix dunnii]|uniref:Ultraviolet-B receptor UVR8 n=1 Tax=Salix dunnii TaxID=1413687 RepID=A0A835J5V1_9ROSI|nr:hypothetical protein SADUNF_Sadunf17G0071100 [Salix dunnii]
MVAAGAEHTAAVTEDGELYGWGWGRYGNLGLGDRNDRLVPEKISGGWRHPMALTSDGNLYGWGLNKKVVQISCRWRHTLAVTERQNVFSWGRGTNGQLGHGESMDWNDSLIRCVLVVTKLFIQSLEKWKVLGFQNLWEHFIFQLISDRFGKIEDSDSLLPLPCLIRPRLH